MPSENKILLVINPISGNVDKSDFLQQVKNLLTERGYTYFIYETKGEKDFANIATLLSQEIFHRVIACGGDGTIAFVAEAIEGKPLCMGIVPLGSSNGLAKSFAIPEDPLEAFEIALTGIPTKVDAVDLNGLKSLHLSDLGLNALLVMNFENSGLRGKVGYLKEVLRTLAEHETFSVKITTDTETIEAEAVIVIIANAQKYGTGVVINPYGNVCDGKFEIVLSRRFDMIELTRLLAGGTNFDPAVVSILSTEAASIEIITGDIHFQVDGEYQGRVEHVAAKIIPEYITIAMPPQTLEELS